MLTAFQVKNLLFIKSAFSYNNAFLKTADILSWIKDQNDRVQVEIKKIPFASLKQWGFDENKNVLKHDSGKFFSIDGIRIRTNGLNPGQWDQPIINQPEIGYLGFITKEFNGILHFLMQAKIEPGNVNYVQLSPTLQATKSNYSRVHKGKSPAYLEYFVNASADQVLVDQLQSEQGARFLKKRNRNIIIKVDEDIPVLENFIWLTLAQIKDIMRYDNIVNMDTRTVISGIPFGDYGQSSIELFNFLSSTKNELSIEAKFFESALCREGAMYHFDEIISFITRLKSKFELDVEKIPLHAVEKWNITSNEIAHQENKYFKIIAAEVSIGNREVINWTQPMVEPAQEGLCAFICKEINGILHFCVQAKLECGNFDIIEFAPTVQCLTGNYRSEESIHSLPFLEYVLHAPSHQVILDALQSEEGGRFFKEQNRNKIVLAGDEIPNELPDNYIWMTLNQLQYFIKFNNYVNIQARSLISAIRFSKEN